MAGQRSTDGCSPQVSHERSQDAIQLSMLTLARAAKKYCQKGISNAHNLLHKQMFVSCISFSFFPDPDTGVMGIVWWVGHCAVTSELK